MVLLLIALWTISSEAIAGTPLFNRPLGEIRGTSPAQVSFDGKRWMPLGSGTLPVFDKMLVKARSGVVALTLFDGSRLEASPTTELAIATMGVVTTVRMTEGNVLFRLPASASVRLWMPGGMIQTAAPGMSRPDRIGATPVSMGAQAQRDTLGVMTAKKGGIPRVRLLSGEVFLVSGNGSVIERLREGQVRTMLAQSSGPTPFKQYAAAQPGGQRTPPPTDPPGQTPKPEHAWAWHPSHPQDVQGGWQELRLGMPPTTPPPPEQELREGFAWAWKDQWVIAKRECGRFVGFRRPSSEEASKLPPPIDPPSQAPKSDHVWAWHSLNPPQIWGGWQEVQLGMPPEDPRRPEQELYHGFTWAWEEQPEQRWVVVEECGLAAAFLVPAGSWVETVAGIAAVGAVVGVPIGILSGDDEPKHVASPSTP